MTILGKGNTIRQVSRSKCFDGTQLVFAHCSEACNCEMSFGVYLPPHAEFDEVPCLWFLSGLTCTHENAIFKSSIQTFASKAGLAVIFPDTSPRGAQIADDDAYDFGKGAGFYVDALLEPWSRHYQMETYITGELYQLVQDNFPVAKDMHGITGFSMGGHGALTLAMRHADKYHSLSAFAPMANPSQSEWGMRQFTAYLGEDLQTWHQHDASHLVRKRGWTREVLIDQGVDDAYWDFLRPWELSNALTETRTPHVFRNHAGYDHSFYFVSSFVEDHVAWHADRLFSIAG